MTPERQVPLNAPSITGLEKQYVQEALDSGWTTTGKYVARFEQEFAAYCGRKYAVACSSGTAALWLAISALGLPQGKRVLSQSYTCGAVASAAINATGRPPLLIDVEIGCWSMDAAELQAALTTRLEEIGAVAFAHTYGVPGRDTEKIERLCRDHGVPCIEDASEAHGAAINGRRTGSFGDLSIFSLRGEKTLGAGQFGIVLTDDERLARKVHQYAHNGLPCDTVRYWETVAGMNCQPANLNAALACAQLERIDDLMAARRAVHERWRGLLADRPGVEFQAAHGTPSWWLTGIILLEAEWGILPQDLGAALLDRGIQTRPGFYPIHVMPHARGANITACDRSSFLLRHLLILPSGPDVTADDQQYVVEQLLDIAGQA